MEGKTAKDTGQARHMPERNQLLTIGDLDDFKVELLNELKSLLQKQCHNTPERWLRSKEVRKMLGISAGTLQAFRVNGLLPFTKIGTIWFYKEEDIIRILVKNSSKKA